MYVVYKHTTPSGKVYIGITTRKPEKRWGNGSGYKENEHFYRAILKYGWQNIKHEIVKDGLNKRQACNLEIELIAKYDSTNPDKGYNHSTGGEYGALGVHPSAETRRKLSEANKGIQRSAETRRKLSEANKGKHPSAETRRKMSEAGKGRIPWNKGKHFSLEARKKMSESHKGANNQNYGKHRSAETRRKISESNKIKHKGMHHSAETRLKMSESQKGKHAKSVICVETGTVYSSGREAAKSTGVSPTAINNVVRGKSKTAGGYHWEYAGGDHEKQISC